MRSSRPYKRLRLARRLWNWKPHPTQREWLLCDAQTKVASCGRRWGKTEAAAIDAATFAILWPGSTQIIVAPTQDQSRLIFSTVERLMLTPALTRNSTSITRSPYPRLTFAGSVIMARTADEDGRNLRGHSADRVIIDEAAYVRDSVVTEVIAPMLADRNGRLVMISTPFGKNHFYRAFRRGMQHPELVEGSLHYASFSFPSWENPHISREYIEAQRAEISQRQFSVEYEAQFVDDMSCVFPLEDIQSAISPSLRRGGPGWGPNDDCLRNDGDCYIVAGIDWARYSDYTALIALAVTENGCRVIGIDRFNRMGWDSQITRVVEFLREHGVNAALADSTSIGDPLLEQLRSRLWETGIDISVAGYGFTNASKRDLIEYLALKFAHRAISIPGEMGTDHTGLSPFFQQLIRELQYFEYELTGSGNIRLNGASGVNDDLVIALSLACWQSRSAVFGPIAASRNGRLATKSW